MLYVFPWADERMTVVHEGVKNPEPFCNGSAAFSPCKDDYSTASSLKQSMFLMSQTNTLLLDGGRHGKQPMASNLS